MSEFVSEQPNLNPELAKNIEEEFPASLATKNAVHMAFEHRAPGHLGMVTYDTPDNREAQIWHDSSGYVANFKYEAYEAGTSEIGAERRRLSWRYRLTRQDDDLTLTRLNWPGRAADGSPEDVSEAEAKRLLADLAQLVERKKTGRYPTRYRREKGI